LTNLELMKVNEEFCVCAWTRDEVTKDPLLAVAGGIGVVKVINTRTNKVVSNLLGHGDVFSLKEWLKEGNLRSKSLSGSSLHHWHRCQ
jgi:hypothetical protein